MDLALVALSAGALYYWETNQPRKMFAVMTLLCLTRDTGVLVVAAFIVFFAIHKSNGGKRWRRGWPRLVPFGLWVVYVMALHPIQNPAVDSGASFRRGPGDSCCTALRMPFRRR